MAKKLIPVLEKTGGPNGESYDSEPMLVDLPAKDQAKLLPLMQQNKDLDDEMIAMEKEVAKKWRGFVELGGEYTDQLTMIHKYQQKSFQAKQDIETYHDALERACIIKQILSNANKNLTRDILQAQRAADDYKFKCMDACVWITVTY